MDWFFRILRLAVLGYLTYQLLHYFFRRWVPKIKLVPSKDKMDVIPQIDNWLQRLYDRNQFHGGILILKDHQPHPFKDLWFSGCGRNHPTYPSIQLPISFSFQTVHSKLESLF